LATTTSPSPVATSGPQPQGGSPGGILRRMEIDPRLFGMLAALAVIWAVFEIWSDGIFISPRNLWNLSLQTSAIGIMATGMVLVIVTRNIDLSVGSMLAVIGVTMALLQVRWLPDWLGLGNPWIWVISLAAGILLGAAIGGFQGVIIAYVGVPAFIVTLGGLLVWRGVAWALSKGQTIAPMDQTFKLLGGGGNATIGGTATWVLAGLASLGLIAALVLGRRRRVKYGFALRPIWADIVIGAVGTGAVLLAAWYLNQYYMPENLARRFVEQSGGTYTGQQIPLGLANPVVIFIVVGLVMTFVATRTRFGRYVFAIGGNPEAAELGGIKTRWTIVKVFIVMGVLTAISAAVLTARLDAATSGLGTLAELYVIAAAVIGGTSLAGGIGTVPGAMLGALVAQSLQSGMVLIGVEAPIQDIVVGIVLVVAVALDSLYRRRVAV
jgi:D-xylose transport system permease protein